MNVIKDVTFDGRVLDMVRKTLEFVKSQVKERTKLGPNAQFITIPEYPEFAWTELIVNAVAHRDYSIHGTDIQIKMFDDRIVVESPGLLPGIVRISNFRTVHFSRNPKIAEFLHRYSYVKEFGEGIDRMFMEMEQAGLPDPEYQANAFMLIATIRNNSSFDDDNDSVNDSDDSENGNVNDSLIKAERKLAQIGAELTDAEKAVYLAFANNPNLSRKELVQTLMLSISTIDRAIKQLKQNNFIERVGSDRKGSWKVL